MELESQVLVREFNRRLRLALTAAPNHVRTEAALEVESHIQDVLNRQSGDPTPEPERVAAILRGFGTPEEYGRALLNQLPGGEATTVSAGAREILIALTDLVGGLWRFSGALVRAALKGSVRGARLLMQGAQWTANQLEAGLNAARGPASKAAQRLAADGAELGHLGRRAFRWAGRVSHGAGELGRQVLRGVRPVLKWVAHTLGLTVLTALALATLGLAGFAAIAPDLVGFELYRLQAEVAFQLDSLRAAYDIARYSASTQAMFHQSGLQVAWISAATGALLLLLLTYVVWTARRRRRSPV